MLEYVIDVAEIEELQTIGNRDALDIIFERAGRTVIGGGNVLLVRKQPGRPTEPFDTITTEADLKAYRQQVVKYME